MTFILDELCEFINGGAWSDKEYVDNGLPILKVTNMKPKGFDLEDIDYLPLSSAEKYAKNKLMIGDVVIATVGSHPNLVDSAAGRSCVINSIVEGFYLNQNAVCIRTKNPNKLDQGFLGYLTKDRLFQHYIQMRGKGAANQMRISIGAIKSYEYNFPEIRIQRKIGEILSKFDYLITNNQKRIKLLEEVAQRIYNEWFVDLKFPGRISGQIYEGLPDGWFTGILADIGKFKRGKTITKKQVTCGNIPVVAGGKEPAYYHNIANTEAPVITISASGNAGYTRLYYQKIWASDCSYLDASETENLFYIYLFLKSKQEDLISMQRGACQQHIYAKDINTMEIVIPSENVLRLFREKIQAIFEEISALERQLHLLAQARDRLLPKLMSGEIEV